MRKISVGILGATGMVGQTIIRLMEDHPWFEVSEVAASERSTGKTYEEAMKNRWSASEEIPEGVRDMRLKDAKPGLDCDIVLSALDSSVASEIEKSFAKEGYPVSSNAKNHRMDEDIPLLIPEINHDHLELIERQRKNRGWKGFIITDPNCSTIHMCLALKPLIDSFGIEKVSVTTMQAVSGAGYPGVPSMDIIDNIMPFINDEEEKLETEPLKIFGSEKNAHIQNADIRISAQCNRVSVRYGHMEALSVKFSRKPDREEIIDSFKKFSPIKKLGLPSAPDRPVVYRKEENRPQNKLDLDIEGGMASVIGRLRECSILDYKFVVLGHNLVRGAAGAAILNAELLKAKGYLE
jgi:aspartate-semialdehyde dehydrogenase